MEYFDTDDETDTISTSMLDDEPICDEFSIDVCSHNDSDFECDEESTDLCNPSTPLTPAYSPISSTGDTPCSSHYQGKFKI